MSDALLIKRQWFITSKTSAITDEYTLSIELGSGAYGKVFLAEHKPSHLPRAVKVIHKDNVQDYKTFINELSILRTIDHPNVVTIIETFETPTICYIVLEYCAGGELFSKIIKLKTFTEEKAAKIMKSLLSAVLYCHNHNICHRDLKPENCLFITADDDSDLKIIDFGLSAPLTEEQILHDLLGTPYYLAPEILSGNYTKLVDCWSLGVILYMLLSGNFPFKGKTNNEILMNVYSGEFSFRPRAFKTVSTAAKDLIVRLLTKDPNFRITAQQAYMHPWVQGLSPQQNVLIPVNIFSSMSMFSRSNSLKQVSLSYIATKLGEGNVQKLRTLFQSIDSNGDGVISQREFTSAMQSWVGIGPGSLEAICTHLDTNHNGDIDYNEFLAACLMRDSFSKDEWLRSTFDYFDRDKDGFINSDDLSEYFFGGVTQVVIQQTHIEAIIKQADTNHDGKIDFKEFYALITTDP